MDQTYFQDSYPEDMNVCYGCGTANKEGLHIRSFWEGDESVCHFTPKPYHTAVKGFVYGGLIASLMDCHGTGTASGVKQRQLERAGMDSFDPREIRYVTASLSVQYVKPTPMGGIELRAVPEEVKDRKITVSIRLYAEGEVCATGKVVAVQIPKAFGEPDKENHI